ncbi:hypothetical protein BH24ACT23_BH24ACT23_12060 [soil metagenome]
MADQEHLAPPGDQRGRVEVAAGELLRLLDVDAERIAREPRSVLRADARTREARVNLDAESRECTAGILRLALALSRELAGEVVGAVFGVAVAKEPDHGPTVAPLTRLPPVRVAVVDMGTNSTRLLVADVEGGRVSEVERRSTVTRLGRGVDTSAKLAAEAIEDVCATVADYVSIYESAGAERVSAVATSAVRDADNRGALIGELQERFALSARVLDGDHEARLTYLGATAEDPPTESTLVVDIGGGSTELIIGTGEEPSFHASLQAGTVRHTERHVKHDPAEPTELEKLADDVRTQIDGALEGSDFAGANHGIGVAGTPTSLAAIEQQLDPYDAELVHGYTLSLGSIQRMYSELAAKPLAERLEIPGLHEGRAPTIVAGVVILIQVMRAFGLTEIDVSEHDILYGAALEAAAAAA